MLVTVEGRVCPLASGMGRRETRGGCHSVRCPAAAPTSCGSQELAAWVGRCQRLVQLCASVLCAAPRDGQRQGDALLEAAAGRVMQLLLDASSWKAGLAGEWGGGLGTSCEGVTFSR